MYICLKKQRYTTSSGYILVPLRQQDMELIRQWRNGQTAILRQQKPITTDEQTRYFEERVAPGFRTPHPSEILFSIMKKERCIGYGGLVHVNWEYKRAEISFLVQLGIQETSKLFEKLFLEFVDVLKEIAFDELQFHRLTAECYAIRPKIPYLLQKSGFRKEGHLVSYVYKGGCWVDAYMYGLINSSKCASMQQGVLISCSSKKVPLIEAVRRAAYKAESFCTIHGCDSDPNVISRHFVDHFWHVPPFEKLKIHDVVRYCKKHNVGAVIPTSDRELAFWAGAKAFLHKNGIHVMVSNVQALQICHDKLAFMKFVKKLKCTAIPTVTSLEELTAKSIVVKERRGAGSHHLGLKLSPKEAHAFAQTLQESLFQPYIHGVEYSIDLFASHKKVHGIVVRERNVIVDGESQVTTTVCNKTLEAQVMRVARALNIYGHAVFQVIQAKNGAYYFVECNPRFGGASTASLEVGLDSFYWFFMECKKEALPPFVRKESEIRQVRYPQDMTCLLS